MSLCYHDVRFNEALTVGYKRVGFSGPELVDQYEEIAKTFPEAPWLVVLRNSDEARVAFMRKAERSGDSELVALERFDTFWKSRCDSLARLCGHANVLTVSYEDTEREDAMRTAWDHVLTGFCFDAQRFSLLLKLNVQQHVPEHVHA